MVWVVFAIFVIFAIFAGLAALGFRWSLWAVAAGLAAHGLFDVFRHLALAGRGVPGWWPDFCMGFDVAAGAWLALLLAVDRRR